MSNLKLTSSSQNWEISGARIYNPNSSLTLDASGNYSLLLKTNGTNRLTISGAGLITFGTLGSYNPSTNVLSAPTVNATTGFQKGATGIVSMVYGDISLTASTTITQYTLTMPSGCDCYNLVSWNPVAAVNNYLTIYNWSLGPWSGPLAANQMLITAALGNGVHLEPFTIRFYWRI
jgi:hypothetical protein